MKIAQRHSISCKIALLVFSLFSIQFTMAQTTIVHTADSVDGTTVVIPGKEYERSGYHDFWWGKHYRKEWNTPVRVQNFYLDTAKGGLIPYMEGGGRQTKTLRLKSRDAREYVLRSINKDFSRSVPETRGTFLARILKDQGSVGHPFAAITITPMSEAAGIYHTIPQVVFVPAQAALGEYNQEFGDQLYLFEERPDENWEDAPNFGYSKNIIGSDRLWEHIFRDNDNRVDQVAFVRARLFDIFIGDWSRHPDNWRWARFDKGKETLYRPVPRDRDQAYTLFDGFYPSLAGKFYKPFQGFHYSIKSVKNWNLPGRTLDKKFLAGLEKDIWLREAAFLQKVLTDSLIESSIRLLPPDVFVLSGDELIGKLKSRRDRLLGFANAYYDFLASNTDLIGTQDREYFTVNRLTGGETEITVHKITKEGVLHKEPLYSRKFKKSETKEVRIYSLENKDVVEIKGEGGAKPIKIRIIDPDATDSIVFARKDLHKQVRTSIGKKFEYDTARQEKLDISVRPIISSSRYKVFDNDLLKLFTRTGVKMVASVTYTAQPWKKARYETVHHLCANYGIFRGTFNVGYVGRLSRLAGKWDLLLKARLDAPAVENYFGTGNNTKLDNDTRNYYRTFSRRMFGGLGIERDFARFHHAEFAVFYQSVKVEPTSDHFISASHQLVDPDVFKLNRYAGVQAGYSFLKANDQLAPTEGIGFNLGTGYISNLGEKNKDFVKAVASAFVYVPLNKRFSLAVRAGGGIISGDAPYYYQNTVGGAGVGEIRGYDRERFYGKHSFHLNNDLRWIFPTRNFIFNGRAGLLGFYDIGRVWQPGEVSKLWHDSYGFGVLVVPYNKFAVSATYGISKEGNYLHFKAGFFF